MPDTYPIAQRCSSVVGEIKDLIVSAKYTLSVSSCPLPEAGDGRRDDRAISQQLKRKCNIHIHPSLNRRANRTAFSRIFPLH